MTENEAKKWVRAISATQSESNHTSSLESRKEALYMAIKALEEIQQYRAIGTVDECAEMQVQYNYLSTKIKKYEAIGTIEEFKALKDDTIPIIHGKSELELHDKQIRAKAIDELKNEICTHFADWKYSEDEKCIKDLIELASESVEEIAEQMKAGGKNE